MPDTDYIVGQAARIEAVITDIAGAAVEPETVSLITLAPDGTKTEIPAGEIVKDAAGAYHYDLALSQPGRWYYRFESSAPAAAAEDTLNVKPSRFK